MGRMLPAGRKSAAADNKPSPAARRAIREAIRTKTKQIPVSDEKKSK
jgi:hypothetical protein